MPPLAQSENGPTSHSHKTAIVLTDGKPGRYTSTGTVGLLTFIIRSSLDDLADKMDGLLSALLSVIKRYLSCLVDTVS